MTTNYTPGALTKLSIGGTAMAVISEDLGEKDTHLEREGLRGSRSHSADDVRIGPKHVGGKIVMEPSPAEMLALLQYAIGAGGNANDALTTFAVVVDRVTKVSTYPTNAVNRLKLSGRQGGILRAEVDLIGESETSNSGTVAPPNSAAPYIFSDITLTLAGSSRDTESFDLEINNHIDGERFLNYTTLQQLVALDRTVGLRTTHPNSDANQDLLNQALAGATGSLAITDAGASNTTHTITFGTLQVPYKTPAIPGNREVLIELDMAARKTGNSAEISVT
jgi:Phage tail tube protein